MPVRVAQVNVGTSSPRPQSAILVPVPAAEPLVELGRDRHDSLAPAGVPAHVTLIVPWLPPAEIGAQDVEQLTKCLADVPAFDFELTRVAWFGRRVLWAAPEPADVFGSLTTTLADQFGTPPWGNEFKEVIPHLTVAHTSGDGGDLVIVEREVSRRLPVACRASEVWVMVGDGRHWSVEAKIALVAAPAGSSPDGVLPRRLGRLSRPDAAPARPGAWRPGATGVPRSR